MNQKTIKHGWKHAPHGWKMSLKAQARAELALRWNTSERAQGILTSFGQYWRGLAAKKGVGRPPQKEAA